MKSGRAKTGVVVHIIVNGYTLCGVKVDSTYTFIEISTYKIPRFFNDTKDICQRCEREFIANANRLDA